MTNFSLRFLIHLFFYAGVYCIGIVQWLFLYRTKLFVQCMVTKEIV